MKYTHLTWTLLAILLVAFVAAAPPSGSPEQISIPSGWFPDSNDGVASCSDPDGESDSSATTVTCSPATQDCTNIEDTCSNGLLLEAVCTSDFTSGTKTINCPHGCQDGKCNQYPVTDYTVELTSPADGFAMDPGTTDFRGRVEPVPNYCNFVFDGRTTAVPVSMTTQQLTPNIRQLLARPSQELPPGSHTWGFVCTNVTTGTKAFSPERTIIIELQPTLVISSIQPRGQSYEARTEVLFNATVTTNMGEVPTCDVRITGPETVNEPATVKGTKVTYARTFATPGEYTWNLTCAGATTNSSEGLFLVLDRPPLFAITHLMTDKLEYNAAENVEFSADLVMRVQGTMAESCELLVGKDNNFTSIAVSPAEQLLIDHTFSANDTGVFEYKFSCTLDDQTLESSIREFTIREDIAILELSPGPNTVRGYGTVTFEAVTNNPAECTLDIEGARHQLSTGVTQKVSLPFTQDLVGVYDWSVTCKAFGKTFTSAPRSLEILDEPFNVIDVAVDKEQYLVGDTVKLSGTGLAPGDTHIIELFDDGNSRVDLKELPANILGYLSYNYEIPLTAESGEYHFLVENKANAAETGEVHFTIALPEPEIRLNTRTVIEAENITVRGEDFLPGMEVRITVERDGAIISDETRDADEAGEFRWSFLAPVTPATYTVRAAQEEVSLEATDQFEVIFFEVIPEKTYYRDADGDGYGSQSDTKQAQTLPPGYVDRAGDCDDVRDRISPSAQETCDGLDNNCDGLRDNGDLCAAGKECTAGMCKVVQVDTPVYQPPTTPTTPTAPVTPPVIERPTTPVPPQPTEPVDEGLSLLWWILIPILVLILLGGGFIGFLAYEGYLDTSSPDAFMAGVRKALGIDDQKQEQVVVPQGDYQLLAKFISSKRQEGFDDLTIRNSLLKKGWSEAEVDAVFDDMYK